MKHLEIEKIRRTPGASILLFITDRCPVACAHCSVDSTANGRMIDDFSFFTELIEGIAALPRLQVIGISGGEPFSERRGLIQACDAFKAEGKSIVVYTSGIWATSAEPTAWIKKVLRQCSTVYLSTDSFHQARATTSHFVRAARQIADAGGWIVVQTLEIQGAALLLHEAFGKNHHQHAELVEIQPLRNGRGIGVFSIQKTLAASQVGTCSLAVTPVVRYDGCITSCCNEDIIMGKGPSRFRNLAYDRKSLRDVLDRYLADPMMRCIAQVGLGNLLAHPKLKHLAAQPVLNNCDLCWKVCKEFPTLNAPDRLIHSIAELGESS